MESQKLYRVQREDLPKLQELLTECFAEDPLYLSLIPDEDTRKRLLPELFECDLTEFFENCEIYADSRDLNGILVVADSSVHVNPIQYFLTEMRARLKTDEYLIKEDMSLRTLWHFILGRDYLNSSWTDQLHQQRRLHIIYLAVRPSMQHHGISALLMEEAITYASKNRMMISLETHNEKNVDMYRHFGFKLFGIVEKHFGLKQYCMVREI